MQMRTCLLFVSCILANPLVAYENTAHLLNVEKIKEKNSGKLKVKCTDKTKGTISFEDDSICVFSKTNRKNQCQQTSQWSVEDAAAFICDGNITDNKQLDAGEFIENE